MDTTYFGRGFGVQEQPCGLYLMFINYPIGYQKDDEFIALLITF
jgi:hypothetical protein